MKTKLLKKISIGTALFLAIAFGIWMSPFIYQAIKMSQKKQRLEQITNYAQITQDCLVLLSNLPPDTLIRNGDDRLPPFIQGLQPRSVYVGINSVRLEFAGGFDHFGYRLIPSQKSNQWTLNWYTEKSLNPLFSTEAKQHELNSDPKPQESFQMEQAEMILIRNNFGLWIIGFLLILVLLIGAILLWFWNGSMSRERIISELKPGTPYSQVINRLGTPLEIRLDPEEFMPWLDKCGCPVPPSFGTNSILHVYTHRGPPYYYIFIFIDKNSNSVVKVTPCGM